jgi:hypothetical protein
MEPPESKKLWRKREMYEDEIIEVANGRVNRELEQWYDAKVKDLALLLVEKLESQNIRIRRFELEKDVQGLELENDIQRLPLEVPEEVSLKMKVALYAQVSSDQQAEKNNSIPSQLRLLHEYALKHKMEVVKEYMDEGESALSDQ